MEKNVTLSVNMSNRETTKSIFKRMIGTWTSITQKVKMTAEWLRLYYSGILGKNITMQQTWLLIKAQTAFFLGIFPADMSILLRFALGIWMVYTFIQCKNADI
jgi:hypothetical protein